MLRSRTLGLPGNVRPRTLSVLQGIFVVVCYSLKASAKVGPWVQVTLNVLRTRQNAIKKVYSSGSLAVLPHQSLSLLDA